MSASRNNALKFGAVSWGNNMSSRNSVHQILRLAATAAAFIALPVYAQADQPMAPEQTAALDSLIDASAQLGSGMDLVRSQILSGNLLEAAASLERISMQYPDATEVGFLHAALLCRLDDVDGGRLEILQMGDRPGATDALRNAQTACGIGEKS
jgi:Flp pilus assembly protein TadD